jgi:hypothetical protein
MNDKQTGGPAFPLVIPPEHSYSTGMTLRDYFAAKAMQALMTRYAYDEKLPDRAYKVADTMLKAREKQ